MHRSLVALAALAGAGALVIGAPAALAGPPPPSHAEAIVAQVDGLLGIGHTSADAGQNSGQATGNAVEIGGNPPSAQFGGTQSGTGSSHNSLFDTGSTPLGRLQITPWDATVNASPTSTTSTGNASVAKLDLLPQNGVPLLSTNVLGSSSTANWNDQSSSSHAVADGAAVNLAGQLTVVLLHSETDSSNGGSSALLVLNGTPIGTGEQLGAVCNLDVPQVLKLLCLTATGGNGVPAAAQVLGATLLDNGQLTGTVAQTTSTGGTTTSDNGGGNPGGGTPGGGGNNGGTGVLGNETSNTGAAGTAVSGSGLVRTGADVARNVAVALALVSLGAALLALSEARRRLAFALPRPGAG